MADNSLPKVPERNLDLVTYEQVKEIRVVDTSDNSKTLAINNLTIAGTKVTVAVDGLSGTVDGAFGDVLTAIAEKADTTQVEALDAEKLDITNVYNGLDKTVEGFALDARQGKALDDKKIDKTAVKQVVGTSETDVLSQKKSIDIDSETVNLLKQSIGGVLQIGTGASWTNAGYIESATGNIISNSDYVYSDLYKVIPNATINISNFGGTTSLRKIEWVDKYGVALTTGHIVSLSSSISAVIPSSAVYARFCYKKFESGVLQTLGVATYSETVSERLDGIELFKILDLSNSINRGAIPIVKSAIRSVNVIGATFVNGETYSLTVCTNTETIAQLRIYKRIGSTNTEVCRYSVSQTALKTGIEIVSVPAFNSSGVSAVIVIDWDKITTMYNQLYPDVWKFNDIVYLKKNTDFGFIGYENTNKIFSSINDTIHGKTIHGSAWTNSGYISNSTGLPVASALHVYSDKYVCYPNTRITFSNFNGSSSIRKVEFFDKDEVAITEGVFVSNSTVLNGMVYAPINARYVRFCYQKNNGSVDFAEPARVIFDIWERRQSKIIATLPDFSKLNNAIISNQGVLAIGDQTWKKHLQLQVDTYIEHLKLVAAIHINSLPDSVLNVGIGRYSDGIISNTELRVTLTDMELWLIDPIGADTLELQIPLTGITVAAGSDLILSLEKTTDGCVCSVSDGATTISKTVSKTTDSGIDDEFEFSKCWGYPYISVTDGNILIKSVSVSCDYNFTTPKIGFWGDSFIEGYTLIPYGLENRYCAQIAAAVGETMCPIFGKGGEALSSGWFYNFSNENDWFRPKYVLIGLGTNNTVFATYQTLMLSTIAHINKCGQIPILVTVTPRPDTEGSTTYADFRVAANAWIRETAGERYIDMAKAVTEVGDESTWRSGYVLADNTHPSVTGHNAMFLQAKIDVPEIFEA